MQENKLRSLVRETIRQVLKESLEEAYPKAGQNGYVAVKNLRKGDILGATGVEVINVSAGAMTPSGQVEVTVKTPKGQEVTKTWNKNTVVKVTNRTNENQPATAPGKPKTEPAVHPGKPDTGKPKPRRPLGNPQVQPKPKAMNEQEMLDKIVDRFKSKNNG